MPHPLECELFVQDPNDKDKKIPVLKETRWLLGTIEGPWWFRWSWKIITPGLLLLIVPWVLYYQSCSSNHSAMEPTPSTQAEVTTPPVSPANVEEKVQTREKASVSNTLVNNGEISVSIPAPNPASTPPPSPEAEVIKIERRITRGIIPSAQQ